VRPPAAAAAGNGCSNAVEWQQRGAEAPAGPAAVSGRDLMALEAADCSAVLQLQRRLDRLCSIGGAPGWCGGSGLRVLCNVPGGSCQVVLTACCNRAIAGQAVLRIPQNTTVSAARIPQLPVGGCKQLRSFINRLPLLLMHHLPCPTHPSLSETEVVRHQDDEAQQLSHISRLGLLTGQGIRVMDPFLARSSSSSSGSSSGGSFVRASSAPYLPPPESSLLRRFSVNSSRSLLEGAATGGPALAGGARIRLQLSDRDGRAAEQHHWRV